VGRTIEERLQQLEDEQAIRQCLYTYGHALDYGLRDEWVDLWSERAVLHWPHESYRGPAAIAGAYDGHSHAPEAYHKHFLVEPRIRVERDRATVDSYFTRINDSPQGPLLRSFGRYRDVLVRCDDGRWRFLERRLERESLIRGAPVT
jgi:ketosteroid isomerase-like protein